MARIIDFPDGFSSAVAPTTSGAIASFAQSFATDSAYETEYGTPPYAGYNGFYFNTTLLKLRIHDGTEWRTNERALDNVTTSDPTASDDNTVGYELLSLWLNSSSGALFRAVDVSTGSAVWQEIASDAVLDAHINSSAIHIDWSVTGAEDIHPDRYNEYSHPNHTGEVTSSGDGNQTVQATAISNKTLKSTPSGTEEVLINDGGTLKKTTVQDIIDLASSGTSVSVATIRHTETSGSSGGDFTSGSYNTRKLNTLYDPDGIVNSLATDRFELLAGKYFITGWTHGYDVGSFRCRLRNTTDSTTERLGSSEYSLPSFPCSIKSEFAVLVDYGSTKEFELQERCSSTKLGSGRGIACTFGDTETYAEVTIYKIG